MGIKKVIVYILLLFFYVASNLQSETPLNFHYTTLYMTPSENMVSFVGDTHLAIAGNERSVLLYDLEKNKLLKELLGFPSNIETLAVSADGQFLASSCAKGEIIIHDLKTLQLVDRLSAGNNYIFNLTFSPDGRYILGNIGSEPSDQLLIIDRNTRSTATIPTGHDVVFGISVSYDNRYCITYQRERLHIFDLSTKQKTGEIRIREKATNPPWPLVTVRTSPTSNIVLIADSLGAMTFYNLVTRQLVKSINAKNVIEAQWSPDGQRVFYLTGSSLVEMDYASGSVLNTVECTWDNLRISKSGTRLMTREGSGIYNILVYEYKSGKMDKIFSRSTTLQYIHKIYPVSARYFMLENRYYDKRLVDLREGRVLNYIGDNTDQITSIDVSMDGFYFITGSRDKSITLYDKETKGRAAILKGHEGGIINTHQLPGNRFLTLGEDNCAILWDIDKLHELGRYQDESINNVISMKVSKDDTLLYLGTHTGEIFVWDIEEYQLLYTYKVSEEGLVAFSVAEDGKSILLFFYDATFAVYNTETGKTSPSQKGYYETTRFCSPDGDIAYAEGEVLKIISPEGTIDLTGHAGDIWSLCVTEDYRFIYSLSEDKTIKTWDTETRRQINSAQIGKEGLCMALSPSGKYLAVANLMEESVSLWDTGTWKETRNLALSDWLWSDAIGFLSENLIGVAGSGRLIVLNSETGGLEWDSALRTRRSGIVCVSESGRFLVNRRGGSLLEFYDLDTETFLWSLDLPKLNVTGGKFSVNDTRIIINTKEGKSFLINAGNGMVILSDTAAIEISPKGDYLAVNRGKQLEMYRLTEGGTKLTLLWSKKVSSGDNSYSDLAFSGDGSLLSYYLGSTIVRYSENGSEPIDLQYDGSCYISPAAGYMTYYQGYLLPHIYSLKTKREVFLGKLSTELSFKNSTWVAEEVQFDDTDTTVAITNTKGVVRLYQVSTEKLLWEYQFPESEEGGRIETYFTSRNEVVVTQRRKDYNRTVAVLDKTSGRLIRKYSMDSSLQDFIDGQNRYSGSHCFEDMIKIYPIDSEKVYTLYYLGDEGWIFHDDTNYTASNKYIENLHLIDENRELRDDVKYSRYRPYLSVIDYRTDGAEGSAQDRQVAQIAARESLPPELPRDMVLIEGGSFQMGSAKDYVYARPSHTVKVSSFYMSRYEVTQGLYQEVMGSNPSDQTRGFGDTYPVNMVTWYEAVNFCNRLSLRDGLQPVYTINGNNVACDWTKNGYRLPTEAEREYVARGGKKGTEYTYAGSENLQDVGWIEQNSNGQNHPVGLKKANELGLYDLSGNVWEWCWDWYGNYTGSNRYNPSGPSTGVSKILRGGSWFDKEEYVRITFRNLYSPDKRYSHCGFRIVRYP